MAASVRRSCAVLVPRALVALSASGATAGAWAAAARGAAAAAQGGPGAAAAAARAGAPARGFAAQGVHSVLVEVPPGPGGTERALKKLKRRTLESGLIKTLRARQFYQKPSEERVLMRKERDKRVARRRMKFKLGWILRKRARGF